ncbi:MAG: WG repeat-containing protein [Catonella sp.]|uniref:WG repeat-containing protein n=1 Tax=Catonella sp. TaxID=2382125 RepID=UPI003FA03D6E
MLRTSFIPSSLIPSTTYAASFLITPSSRTETVRVGEGVSEKYFCIDKEGKRYGEEYDDIFINENGAKIVVGKSYKDYKYGLVNKKGKIIVKPQYTYIENFDKGIAIAAKNGKEGCLNLKGEVVIPVKYDVVSSFMEDDRVIVERKGKYGLLDRKGKEHIPFLYENLDKISENLYYVKKDKKAGYVDGEGKVIIPAEFDYIFVK